jgi:hypothetical protein
LSGGGTGIRIGEREISNGSGGSLGPLPLFSLSPRLELALCALDPGLLRDQVGYRTLATEQVDYERSLLRKETAAKRLGGDSFKPLDHCYLCLSRLNDPVACSHGHLFCRE